MTGISKKISKIVLIVVTFLILISMFLYFFIQTDTFSRWALDFALNKLNENSQVTGIFVEADSARGSILKELYLKNAVVRFHSDSIFSVASIELKFDLWRLLKHEIKIEDLNINSPVVNLKKIKDSDGSIVWNFSKLFEQSQEPDSTKSPFDWDVVVNNFKIANGRMSVEGQLINDMPEWRLKNLKMKNFDPDNIEMRNIELELNGKYSSGYQDLVIKNLSFNTNSDFNVKKFALNYKVNVKDTISEVNSLELVTGRSEIRIERGRMSGINIADSKSFENLRDKEVEAEINIKEFNFADLRFFLPSVDMLDSVAGLSLTADGKYGNLNIKKLNLSLHNSEINLTGNLKNLDEPGKLFIDAEIKNTRIYPEDVATLLNEKSIADFRNAGPVYPDLTYTGTVDNFLSKFDITTSAGNLYGNVNIDLTNEGYRGKITTENLNPGKFLKDNFSKGNINVSADFAGIGFNPKSTKTNVTYTMGHSQFAGYNINNSSGKIGLNGNALDINARFSSPMGNLNVKGNVNISDIKNPVYNLSGDVRNLNIASFTKSDEDQSNLNFSYNIKGKGISPQNLNGSYNFSVLQSSYGSLQTPDAPISLSVQTSGNSKTINLVSDAAEFNAEGKFKLNELVNVLKQNAESVSENISQKLMLSESSDTPNVSFIGNEDIDFDYSFVVKDSVETNRLLAPYGIIFNGNSSGHIENGNNGFVSDLRINAPSFVFRDTLVVLKNFSSDLHLSNTPGNLKINLQSSAEKIFFDNIAFDSAGVLLNLDNSQASIDALVRRNSDLYGRFKSAFSFRRESIVATADTATLIFDNYNIQNAGDWIFKMDNEDLEIEQMKLRSRNTTADISGKYSFDSNSDLTLKANDVKLKDFRDAIFPIEFADTSENEKRYAEGVLEELFINFKGTPLNPEMTVRMQSSELTHSNESIGTIDVKALYKNDNAVLDVEIINPGDSGRLTLKGNLPYVNPFSESESPGFANTPVSLQLRADDFQFKHITGMIPILSGLKGALNGDIKVTGVTSVPVLDGELKISEGSFHSDLTGMNYSFDLNADARNTKLILNDLKLYNKDDKTKHIDLFGSIDFSGLRINDMDFQLSGDMVLLNDKVQYNLLGVNGNVLGGIGYPAITIKGNLEKLKIRGQLIINKAKISSIPKGTSGYELTGDNFVYVLNEYDTNKIVRDTVIYIPEKEYFGINPFQKRKYAIDTSRNKLPEFLDINVNVKTVKSVSASVDIKKLTRAKLYGDVNSNLTFKTINNELRAFGNINVVGSSYFKFYRTFKLNDSKITFDGPIDDPVLNIQAVYTGSKVSEERGTARTSEVEVKLIITGRASKPEVKTALIENGSEVTGSNGQADAISYLLFGRFKSDLTTPERTVMASSFGSVYLSYFVTQTLQSIFPFILDAEFNYVQGTEPHTEVQMMSEFGEATVTVGANIFRESTNLEYSIDYPLNKLLKADLPEKIMIELYQEQLGDEVISNSQTESTTGLKIIYKFKF